LLQEADEKIKINANLLLKTRKELEKQILDLEEDLDSRVGRVMG